jgi:hypothetical protein
MTVFDLIERLKKMDPNYVVVMSSNPKGDKLSLLYKISSQLWIEKDRTSPYTYPIGDDEEDLDDEGRLAVILWPMK